jgi:antitoxin component of MazEF toxin-antitoxin module
MATGQVSSKIFRTEGKLAVSLPPESLALWGLEEGSEVSVSLDQESGRIIVEPMAMKTAVIDSEFARQVQEFIEQYKPALDTLAK